MVEDVEEVEVDDEVEPLEVLEDEPEEEADEEADEEVRPPEQL